MKYLLVLLALTIGSTTFAQKKSSQASQKAYSRDYGMAGCGLGSLVMGKDGGQILAATTNGTFYSQLFGITSETLNCVDDNISQVAHNSDVYIQFNKFALQGDIAQGQGETLAAYTEIMGCKNSAQVSGLLKSNYETIFSKGNSTPNEITDSIITVIQSDDQIAQSCQLG